VLLAGRWLYTFKTEKESILLTPPQFFSPQTRLRMEVVFKDDFRSLIDIERFFMNRLPFFFPSKLPEIFLPNKERR